MDHILIVEDDRALSQGIRLALDQAGRQFTQCHTLREAEEALAAHPPQLVILDLNLPDGNGLDLLRRSRPAAPVLELPPYVFDFGRMVYTKNGVPLDLSKTEQRLLRLLAEHRGQTLTREQLLDRVWDGGEFVDENALSVAVNRLRRKLGEAPIRTVYGVGYVWAEG